MMLHIMVRRFCLKLTLVWLGHGEEPYHITTSSISYLWSVSLTICCILIAKEVVETSQ